MYVTITELPDTITSALKSVGYGRKDINVEPRETVSVQDMGSSGRRGFVVLVDIATGRTELHQGSWGGANMFNPANAVDLDGAERQIIPGMAVIKGSEGDTVYATLYLHPDNLVKMLPAKPEVTKREAGILYVFCAYKSSSRKEELARKGVTPAELASLVTRGFLSVNKVGTTITTTGKNAAKDAL
jgi:hypothetical protein